MPGFPCAAALSAVTAICGFAYVSDPQTGRGGRNFAFAAKFLWLQVAAPCNHGVGWMKPT